MHGKEAEVSHKKRWETNITYVLGMAIGFSRIVEKDKCVTRCNFCATFSVSQTDLGSDVVNSKYKLLQKVLICSHDDH